MGQNSNIEWTHHTFNPWSGCTKVSDGCKNCYAAVNYSVKMRGVKWGPQGNRIIKAESGWKEPLKWDQDAAAAGERHRVFCASLADVFEGADTMPADALAGVRAARVRLFDLIRKTPNLDWLLLTKRPENWRDIIEETIILAEGGDPDDKNYFVDNDGSFPANELSDWLNQWTGDDAPANVWLGTSVENQAAAAERIPHLLRCPAAVRFLSCEPLLGPIDLRVEKVSFVDSLGGPREEWRDEIPDGIGWIIVGGESGSGARPMHPQWARNIRDQCVAAGVPYFFKQTGEWIAKDQIADCTEDGWQTRSEWAGKLAGLDWGLLNIKGEFCPAMTTWNSRQNHPTDDYEVTIYRVGKRAAGRTLDGRTWDQFPAPVEAVQHG